MATAKTLVSKHSIKELVEMAKELGMESSDLDNMTKRDIADEIVMLTAETPKVQRAAAPAFPYEAVPGQPGRYFHPWPHGEEYEALEAKRQDLNGAIASAQEEVEKRQADVRWRKNNRPDLVDEYVAKKVIPRLESIALWERELAPIQDRIEEMRRALSEPVEAWTKHLAETLAALADYSGLLVTNSYGDSITIETLDEKGGRSWPEATVYFPRKGFGLSADDVDGRATFTFEPATVSVGSYSDKSVEMARKVQRVLGVAIEIAEAVNRAYGIES